jgi:hypothetical protein
MRKSAWSPVLLVWLATLALAAPKVGHADNLTNLSLEQLTPAEKALVGGAARAGSTYSFKQDNGKLVLDYIDSGDSITVFSSVFGVGSASQASVSSIAMPRANFFRGRNLNDPLTNIALDALTAEQRALVQNMGQVRTGTKYTFKRDGAGKLLLDYIDSGNSHLVVFDGPGPGKTRYPLRSDFFDKERHIRDPYASAPSPPQLAGKGQPARKAPATCLDGRPIPMKAQTTSHWGGFLVFDTGSPPMATRSQKEGILIVTANGCVTESRFQPRFSIARFK